MPQRGREGDPQLRGGLILSFRAVAREREEGDQMWGGVSEATDFICATRMGIAALCARRPVAAWGPS